MSQKKDIAKLKKSLMKVSDKILAKINIINTTTQTSNVFWNGMTVALKADYEELRVIYKAWNEAAIPKYYKIQAQDDIAYVKGIKFTPKTAVKYRTFINTNINVQTISTILNDSLSTFYLALDGGEKSLNKMLRLTQQLLIDEKAVNNFISKGFLEGAPGIKDPTALVGRGTTYGAKQKLKQELMAKSLDGKYITIIDKNGRTMRWKIDTYAELVARTKLREAQSLATINTGLAYGSDLVQVSSHNTTTPVCLPFEGKIFSITGKDKDFPVLTDFPPFHINCLHSITVVFREVLEGRGIDKYIDFSNGTTEIHPTRASHIPISKRKLKQSGVTKKTRGVNSPPMIQRLKDRGLTTISKDKTGKMFLYNASRTEKYHIIKKDYLKYKDIIHKEFGKII